MSFQTVDPVRACQWLEKGEAVLVDVREPDEFARQSIPGAHLAPLGGICAVALPPHEGKKLIMQCGGGGRSAKACAQLSLELPHAQIYNLEGGIRAWAALGLPTRGDAAATQACALPQKA